ncbi:MAG: hypothetical protein F6K40_36435, partial [Okeania sp. SIO3I5]|uniref:hypothetical protein n=1 Tax=Okeania sp. SIO3I5 TaxID=2607805 RepID=UPI0013BDFA48
DTDLATDTRMIRQLSVISYQLSVTTAETGGHDTDLATDTRMSRQLSVTTAETGGHDTDLATDTRMIRQLFSYQYRLLKLEG